MKEKYVTYNEIISNLLKNPRITEKELAQKYLISERTIRRYLKVLKDKNIIEYYKNGKTRYWITKKKYYSN